MWWNESLHYLSFIRCIVVRVTCYIWNNKHWNFRIHSYLAVKLLSRKCFVHKQKGRYDINCLKVGYFLRMGKLLQIINSWNTKFSVYSWTGKTIIYHCFLNLHDFNLYNLQFMASSSVNVALYSDFFIVRLTCYNGAWEKIEQMSNRIN